MAPGQSKKAEVAEMLERGLTPREIAVLLQISTQAVWKHRQAIAREDGPPTASEQIEAAGFRNPHP